MPDPTPNPLWTELAARAGVALSDAQLHSLCRYLDLLSAANETMNLTRITTRAAAEALHVGDALTLLPFLPPAAHDLADVGSGGGVPGIPLAVARPDARILLVESTRKKAAFLRDAVRELALPNVRVTERRAEDVGSPDPSPANPESVDSPDEPSERESFDVAVARAVATMVWLAEWCLPLVKKGEKVLAMKGPKVADELPGAAKAIRLLGGGAPVIHPARLPGAENHVVVEIPKIARTDRRYPRRAVRAKGRPLA